MFYQAIRAEEISLFWEDRLEGSAMKLFENVIDRFDRLSFLCLL